MLRCIIILAFLACVFLATEVNGQQECMELAYCASVEADMRGIQASALVKYRAAADAVVLHKNHLLSKNNSIKTCKSKLKTCMTSTRSLAVQKFKFPKKYYTCTYRTYSRAIFGCKNLDKWLPAVSGILPIRSLQCREDCIVDEVKPVLLSNGKRLLDYKNPIEQASLMVKFWICDFQCLTIESITDNGVCLIYLKQARATGSVRLEGRTRPSSRRIDKFYSSGVRNESEWSPIDTCEEGSWVRSILPYFGYLNVLYFGCTKDVSDKSYVELLDNNPWKGNLYDRIGVAATTRLLLSCGPREDNSFIVGIQAYRGKADGIIQLINYLCANETTWRNAHDDWPFDPSKFYPPINLVCKNKTAVCSLQSTSAQDPVQKWDIMADIRIGCCAGNPKKPGHFVNAVPESEGEKPEFCDISKPRAAECASCSKCQCCIVVDSEMVVPRQGSKESFKVTPSVAPSTWHVIMAAISQQLSPSLTTKLNWREKIDGFYGQGPKIVPPLNPQANDPKMMYTWKEYKATCNGVIVTYYEKTLGPKPDCIIFGNCTNEVPQVCNGSDEWRQVATHNSYGRSGDDDGWGKPYYQFDPKLDSNDSTAGSIIHEFTKNFSPSQVTNYNWGEYFQGVQNGPPEDTYTIRLGEVPKGHFINIYQLTGICGEYIIRLEAFKKVKFHFDSKYPDSKLVENCQIAKENGVKLENNDRCPK